MPVDSDFGLLVGSRNSFQPSGGGVQIAVREYVAVLEFAGFKLQRLPFELRYSLRTRVLNRLIPRVMLSETPCGLAGEVDAALRKTPASFIFFCATVFPALSRSLRRRFPHVKQVLLSVGVESLDFCISQQLRNVAGTVNRSSGRVARMLGQQILDEAEQRSLIDAVVTLSALEVEVEKWLGVPRAIWLPRTIMVPPLTLRPVAGRVGCVSTLNHPPNLDGLTRVFEQLVGKVPHNFRFRLVGQPEGEGRALATCFPFVDYLGPLNDEQLRTEATTWCCFVHPLFVYAKGCSTKLAVALGWGLPVATTEFGVRGYRWNERVSPLTRTPAELAMAVIERSRVERLSEFQAQTKQLTELMPALDSVAMSLREFLLELK